MNKCGAARTVSSGAAPTTMRPAAARALCRALSRRAPMPFTASALPPRFAARSSSGISSSSSSSFGGVSPASWAAAAAARHNQQQQQQPFSRSAAAAAAASAVAADPAAAAPTSHAGNGASAAANGAAAASTTAPTFQEAVRRLQDYWAAAGCLVWMPHNTEVGAGTMNPATFLRVLGPEPWNVAYPEPSVRPDDSRYGDNPNRVQRHTQFQVILKPDPGNAQELYLGSLAALGIDTSAHDVRFVEDNWESPVLGAWGLGWEVWLDGMEVTQFTYFQQVRKAAFLDRTLDWAVILDWQWRWRWLWTANPALLHHAHAPLLRLNTPAPVPIDTTRRLPQAGGKVLDAPAVEITYGLERILMARQGVRHFKDIRYADNGVTYGELFLQNEYEMSCYNLDEADVAEQVRGGLRGLPWLHAFLHGCMAACTAWLHACTALQLAQGPFQPPAAFTTTCLTHNTPTTTKQPTKQPTKTHSASALRSLTPRRAACSPSACPSPPTTTS